MRIAFVGVRLTLYEITGFPEWRGLWSLSSGGKLSTAWSGSETTPPRHHKRASGLERSLRFQRASQARQGCPFHRVPQGAALKPGPDTGNDPLDGVGVAEPELHREIVR